MLPAKFGSIWPSSFRGEFFLNSSQSEKRIGSSIKFLRFFPFGQQTWLPRAILVSDWLMLNKSSPLKLIGLMEPNLAGSIYVRYSTLHRCFLPSLAPFGQAVSEENFFLTVANQKKELLLVAKWNHMKKIYRVSYIDASCQVSSM
jgi:hypothetical protein